MKKEQLQQTPPGWEPKKWLAVEKAAARMTRAEILDFYKQTGAVRAANLADWTVEELRGVLDEISAEDAETLLQIYTEHKEKNRR